MENQVVQPADAGKAKIVTTQTFSVDQLANMVINRTQEIARTARQRTEQDARQVTQRANEDARQTAQLQIAKDAYEQAGGDLETLVIPPIQ